MKIDRLRVQNYKSIKDSGWLDLGRRFTVILGKNNVGKTALIEALRHRNAGNRPRRSIEKRIGETLDPESLFQFCVRPEASELRDALSKQGGTIDIPSNVAASRREIRSFLEEFLSGNGVEFELKTVGGGSLEAVGYPSHHMFPDPRGAAQWIRLNVSPGKPIPEGEGPHGGKSDSAAALMINIFEQQIYVFNAERRAVAERAFQEARLLESDAGNLPQVLATLQAENRSLFDRYSAHISEIFPSVRGISILPRGTQVEIQLWNVPLETERTDLAISLSQSGTGVSQALAILYVAMTKKGAVIAIDEPNSFLHPGAAKALIQILGGYDNQYIISTHSTDILAAAQPEQVLFVQWENGETRISEFDGVTIAGSREVLLDLGISASDVLGIEKAIWVEGPTEAACFPLIVRQAVGTLPRGVAFIAVRSVDEVVRKSGVSDVVLDIYTRLSASNPMMPAAIKFTFDRERRTNEQIEQIERESSGAVQFIPAYCYETFLLNDAAISAVINADAERLGIAGVSPSDVSSWLDEKVAGWRDRAELWMRATNGAAMLKHLFADLAKMEYRKTFHSVALTRWLLENDVKHLDVLTRYVVGVLPEGNANS